MRKIHLIALYIILMSNLCAQVNLTNGLVAYYPFNGNANDVSGNGNNGIINGVSLTDDRFGFPKYAYSFNGVSSYITIQNYSLLNSTGEFSYSVFFKPSSNIAGNGNIVTCNDCNDDAFILSTNNGPLLGFNKPSGRLYCWAFFSNGKNLIIPSVTYSWNKDTWYNITVTCDNKFIKLYINGILENTITTNSTKINSGDGYGIVIGKNHWRNMCYLSGSLDEIRIYNRALNQDEISELNYESSTNIQKIFDISPRLVDRNQKYTDINISAIPIDFTTTIKLVNGSTVIKPDSILKRTKYNINARFAFANEPLGLYDVTLISDTVTLKLDRGFRIISLSKPIEPLDTDNDGFRNITDFGNIVWITQHSESWGYKYELDNDLDGSETQYLNDEKGLNPITTFSEIFDGQSHKIRNLYYNNANNDNAAFIGTLAIGGIIRNLGFANCSVSGYNNIAGLVGSNSGTISNCYCSGTVSGYNNVGGIVGNNSGTIKACYNSSLVTGNDNVGALVGNGNSGGSILKCYNIGKIIGKDLNVGGIIGANSGSITDCFNKGMVIGAGEVAGISGRNYGTISKVYNCGYINGTGSYCGAINGYGSGSITNSFWDKEKSGLTTSNGGIGKTTAEMKTQSTYTNLDFANTWEILSTMNDGYPQLKWSNNPARIKSYTPDRTANVDSCMITIEGSGFSDSTKVFLTKKGQATIKADTLNYNDTYCTARFNLKNAAIGSWNLSVQYPDTTITFQNGLTVEEKKAGQLKIEILGADKIRSGRTANVTIRVTNTGNTTIENPLLFIAIDSKDTTFTTHCTNSDIPDSLISNFKKMKLDIKDFSFIKSKNILGHNDRICKLGTFIFPTLMPYNSYDFPIEIKSKQDISISAWRKEDYSINDFIGSSKNNSSAKKVQSLNTDYNCISAFGNCLTNVIGTTLLGAKEFQLFNTAASMGLFTIDQTATAKGVRPNSLTKDLGMLIVGTAGSIALTASAPEVVAVGVILTAINIGVGCTDAVTTCIPDIISKFNIQSVSSFDPNDKIGYRSPSGSRYFKEDNSNFTYEIDFENKSTATAAAQEVLVTDTLDLGKFNIESFRAGTIKIGKNTYPASYNVQENKWQIDMRPGKNLITNITLTLDKVNGIAKWDFKSVDPVTMDWPQDVTLGFLPPNDSIGSGQGSVSFTIDLKTGLASDVAVKNKASIVFDTNAPIITPTWTNTKDIVAPVSTMKQPEIVNDSIVTIKWIGEDNKNGSGVYQYNVYAKKAGDSYASLLSNTTQNSIDFKFKKDIEYDFYVTAKDSAGNEEIKTNVPDITFKGNTLNVIISRKWNDVLVCNNKDSLFNSYQWYKNDAVIAGETKQWYQETGGLNGSYYVKVITKDGIIGTSNTITVNKAAGIKVYPNPTPTGTEFNVKVQSSDADLKGSQLSIFNVTGELVIQKTEVQENMTLKGLQKGYYIVQLKLANGNMLSEKLIVK